MINLLSEISSRNLKVFYLYLMEFMFLCILFSSASASEFQPISQVIKTTDQANSIYADKSVMHGFTYRFEDKVSYSNNYNLYTVGQSCYRGGPIRFSIPVEHFSISIDNQTHQIFGRSVWDKFYVDSRWNFILNWLGSGHWVVALNQDTCADIILDTRYKTAELLQQAREKQFPVTVRDNLGNVIATFTLLMN